MFSDRFKGNLIIWSILLTVLFLPIIVLGVIFDIKKLGWFWGTLYIIFAIYLTTTLLSIL
jgi:hypothetical protein